MTGFSSYFKRPYRTWTVFSIASCCLLSLMLLPSLTALRRSQEIYHEIRRMQGDEKRNRLLVEQLSRNLYLVSIVLREFLLDTSPEVEADYLNRIIRLRSEIQEQVSELEKTSHLEDRSPLVRLRREIDTYWEFMLPVLHWTPKERAERGTYFLREEQRPRRQSILAISDEVRRLNEAFYEQQYEAINLSEREFRGDVQSVMGFAFVSGLLVAGASILRIAWLEKRFVEQHEEAKRRSEELRHLSMKLRHAQEDERKEISRELHDEVGQKLTALRMELGSLGRLRFTQDGEFAERLEEVKLLAEQSLRSIRDIAAGLRPTMLDDLGLQPALQRQARQFSRHTGIPVVTEVRGEIANLQERHKVYIYRIVQESLTNCARHSGAKRINIVLEGNPDGVNLLVEDDGVGFDRSRQRSGIGLIGMEERVRELRGSLEVESRPGEGTRIRVHIPWSSEKWQTESA
ncbi:MAG: sensor histidine kinase [Bryobacteraceae bacterium]|nr:sensor histidine kinase [Bryobacteraceae bacterium]